MKLDVLLLFNCVIYSFFEVEVNVFLYHNSEIFNYGCVKGVRSLIVPGTDFIIGVVVLE